MKSITTSTPNLGYWDTRQGGRAENQDSFGFLDTKIGLIVVVCDGMGGGPAGKQASTIAVQQILGYINQASEDGNPIEILDQAIMQAHNSILLVGEKHHELKGMGTTVVAVLLHNNAAYIAHVGDSRVYQLRRGKKIFRTADHSLVADMIRNKTLTEEQARLTSQTNVITRALGGGKCKADIIERPYERGDRFMLCTDGIWGAFEEKNLIEIAARTPSLAGAVDALVLSADETGRQNGNHHDNLTVALLETKNDSIIKEKMSRKTFLLIRFLMAFCLISFIVNLILAVSLLLPKEEKELLTQQEQEMTVMRSQIKRLLHQKDSLETVIISQKSKVAEEKNKAVEERSKALDERSKAVDEKMRQLEEKTERDAKNVQKKDNQVISENVNNLIEAVVEDLTKARDLKESPKRASLRNGAISNLNKLIKNDPAHKQVYEFVIEELGKPISSSNSEKGKGQYKELISKLKRIK